MKKLPAFYKVLLFALLLACTACGQQDKSAIAKVLDTRSTAMIEKDIHAYISVIFDRYQYHQQKKHDAVQQMQTLFQHFDHINIQTHNRHIHIIDSEHAECEQSYTISASADGVTRNIVQREQLQLIKTPVGWKISSGL